MNDLRINAARLWESLMELAKIGATPKGGVKRLTLTDEDRRARDLFCRWAREAGLAVEVDGIGNVFARRAGSDPSLPPIAMGSHLDSQPSGGKFDGAYGVMAGLEVLRTLNDAGMRTHAPLEVVSWTNEEGSRFTPVLMGSGVFCGLFTLEHVRAQQDLAGLTVGSELERIGYAGQAKPHRLGGYFEAHIEQGPVLENEGKTIGVVQGALGQRWYDVTVTGQDAHAGPTPMELRQDALIGASRLVLEVNRIARGFPDYARGTVGFLQVKPNSRNVIPGEVRTTVDFRNAKASTLDAMCEELKRAAKVIEAECRVSIELRENVYFKPCEFDPALVAHVRAAAAALGHPHRDIVSGAGHDAVSIARVAPAAMVFVPCAGGISHNEIESATPADLAAGCDVLLQAALKAAGVAGASRAAA
jgi:beta-ureidopropionase / N-carbamoyl-L-amino-acid hydrolase